MSIKYGNVSSVVVLTEHASESAAGPVKTQIAGPQAFLESVFLASSPVTLMLLFRKHIENC